ncbi:MAG: cobalamin-dependent protein [Candidatus Humimicrobiaceae bacterium]|jgi:methylmalonyl-CoA mutase C-terminal domain/subunit
MELKIKVLLAKLGLDIHNRGVLTVAKNLRDAGMEIIYIGNSTPEQIIKSAVQEDVDVVGVSSLGGAHLSLGAKLISLAKKEGIKDGKIYLVGGAIPEDDMKKLNAAGFDGIFTSGATKDEIISTIKNLAKKL